MTNHSRLKSIHLAGTAWFILCVGYILVFALRQAGVHWWIIFSVSWHSVLTVFLLISLLICNVQGCYTESGSNRNRTPVNERGLLYGALYHNPIFRRLGRLRWNDRRKCNQAIPVGDRPGNFGSNLSGLGDCGPGGGLAGGAIAINTWRIKTLTSLCPYAGNAKSHTFFPIARVFTLLNRSIYA